MPDGLYERDALAWAEQQAGLLQRLAAGERVNDAVDWANVIGEVQDVGLSELRACRSLLLQAMVHLLKLHAWPGSRSVGHWRDKALAFLDDAEQRYAESMRQRVEFGALYARALRRARAAEDTSGAPRPLPDECPFGLDELLGGNLAVLEAGVRDGLA